MLFNSFNFLVFLPIVFLVYWFGCRNQLQRQNGWLLLASYFFYACWDLRFLLLLLFSTSLDFFAGLQIARTDSPQSKQRWLYGSIAINLGLLGFFKYFNFFADSFAQLLAAAGLHSSPHTLQLLLPLGISFYTFHGISYIIDVYKNRITATRSFPQYALFVSFFPLLVAGPIERATHLLPQLQQPRRFNHQQAVSGLRQILWGLFKKMVIADGCAVYANLIFQQPGMYSSSSLALGAVFFAFQIYTDFSGYSDIALGTARLFGIGVLRNFAYPYFSRDMAEFWRRWHISLSSWFRDYLYIPLGGSRVSKPRQVINVLIIFLVSGFWHGANITFIVWGMLHAIYILPLIIFNRNRQHLGIVAAGRWLPSVKELLTMAGSFVLTVFAWIFFRSSSLSAAADYIQRLFTGALFSKPKPMPKPELLLLLFLFFAAEWLGRQHFCPIEGIGHRWPGPLRWALYFIMVLVIFYFSETPQEFIYFDF